MKLRFTHNQTIAIMLIVCCLVLPTTCLVEVFAAEAVVSYAQDAKLVSLTTPPCDDCPGDDHHDGDCCDATCCNCVCHAPPGEGLQIKYAPLVARQSLSERSWALPQVYRTIFVPPQNQV